MLRQKESEILFINLSNDENIYEVIRWLSCHILDTSSDYQETEIMFPFEEIIEFSNSIKSLTKYHLKIRENRALEIERKVFCIVFSTRLENTEIFKIFELSSYRVNLFIDIATKFTNKEILLWIKSMLQEKFFEEFLTAIWSKEFFESYHGQF